METVPDLLETDIIIETIGNQFGDDVSPVLVQGPCRRKQLPRGVPAVVGRPDLS